MAEDVTAAVAAFAVAVTAVPEHANAAVAKTATGVGDAAGIEARGLAELLADLAIDLLAPVEAELAVQDGENASEARAGHAHEDKAGDPAATKVSEPSETVDAVEAKTARSATDVTACSIPRSTLGPTLAHAVCVICAAVAGPVA